MPATRDDISQWFDRGVKEGASHMIVRCDKFEYHGNPGDQCCYPVYIDKTPEEARKEADKPGDSLMEVYILDIERKQEQVEASHRVFNYE